MMKGAEIIVIVCAVFAAPALAFSNGTILPSYFCNPGDGLPTSLGDVLKSTNITQPVESLIIAGLHNSKDILSRKNLAQISLHAPISGKEVKEIVAGCRYRVVARSTDNTTLEGLIIWGESAPRNKVGKFIQTGELMTIWPACGAGGVGAVHTTAIENLTYSSLIWQAPRIATTQPSRHGSSVSVKRSSASKHLNASTAQTGKSSTGRHNSSIAGSSSSAGHPHNSSIAGNSSTAGQPRNSSVFVGTESISTAPSSVIENHTLRLKIAVSPKEVNKPTTALSTANSGMAKLTKSTVGQKATKSSAKVSGKASMKTAIPVAQVSFRGVTCTDGGFGPWANAPIPLVKGDVCPM